MDSAEKIPPHLRYSSEHEWVHILDEHTVRIGITDFAQLSLGDVVYVTLPQPGSSVTARQACGEVESTKSVSDIYAPIPGEITRVNIEVEARPELVNTDPYGSGWLFELHTDGNGAVSELLDPIAYSHLIESS